jgi:hypothetical protein
MRIRLTRIRKGKWRMRGGDTFFDLHFLALFVEEIVDLDADFCFACCGYCGVGFAAGVGCECHFEWVVDFVLGTKVCTMFVSLGRQVWKLEGIWVGICKARLVL